MAGATGVLGGRVVPLLVAAGHEVTAVARTPEKAATVASAGARPATVDLFDPAGLGAAVAGHDVVCNLATHIPPLSRAARPSAWAENERIRRQASGHLVDAALAGGARRYLQESVVFVYADGGDRWLDEDAPVDAGPNLDSVLAAETQAARFAAGGGAAVVLRFAMFYGPGSSHTDAVLAAAQWRLAFTVGDPGGYSSVVHLDDAAAAVVAALGGSGGTYNVVDDEPLTRGAQAAALAAALGVRRLVPTGRLVARVGGAGALARSQRVSNRRFKDASGWAPRFPSAREGWVDVVAARRGR